MSDWQPADTAPKDGTPILAWTFGEYLTYEAGEEVIKRSPAHVIVQYVPHGSPPWIEVEGEHYSRYDITHWMPLPEPPK